MGAGALPTRRNGPKWQRAGTTPHLRNGFRCWLVCLMWHRRAHRAFLRYLGGYGRCLACGRMWE